MRHTGPCRCFVKCLVVVMALGALLGAAKGQQAALAGDRAVVLSNFLRDVQDPQSSNYKHWLTPAEFEARFGVTAKQVSASGPHPMMLVTEAGGVQAANDGLAALAAVVEANANRVVQVSSAACVEDFDAETQAGMKQVLQQAAAQGITVLAVSGCGTRGSAGFPSGLSDVTSVALSPGLHGTSPEMLTELRPEWQVAQGLPADGFRHEPDVTVSSLAALAATMEKILAREPKSADGSPARLGNIAGELYKLASMPGLYAQPDHAAVGTWEAATGLGVVDLEALGKFYPEGILSNNVSIQLSSGYVTHGTAITFSSTVTDTSGKGGGVVPTGTVTFTTNTGVTLGTATLVNGTGSVSYNTLPGGPYSVSAAYSGDGTYAAATSISTGFAVGGEASVLSGTATTTVVGGTVTVSVTDKSGSGVGTPSGTVSVVPQGTSDTSTYTGTLSGSGGTAIATVSVPAVQAGNIVLQVNCVSADASFTCYNPISVTAVESKGTPSMKLTVSPNPPVTGTTTTFTATVSGAGGKYPTPVGNVSFYDNGTSLGPATLNNGTATYTTSSLSGSVSHSFTASYGGDNNYNGVTVTAGAAVTISSTTTALTITPNPPVYGGTTQLQATVAFTLTNGVAPTGIMSFYMDGALLGSAVTSGGVAVYTSTALSGTTAHTFFAVYGGDTNYQTSTSPAITTAAAGTTATTTTLTVTPNPPVSGSTTTLQATVAQSGSTATPTGTVSFYQDGVLLGSSNVSGGFATYTSTTLSSTTAHAYYAVYSGDTHFTTSTSPTVNTSAAGASVTTTTLTVNPNPPVSGTTTTLTATLGYTLKNSTAPTGSVSFYEDGTLLSTQTLSNGSAQYASTTLSGTASHTFYAVYSGDTNYGTSTSSNVITAAAGATATTATLVVSPNPPLGGTTTTLTTQVGYKLTNGVVPTGSVSFYQDNVLLGTQTLSSSSVATYTSTTLTSATTHTYYAIYSGDTNYASSTTPPVSTSASTASLTTTTTLTITPNPPVSGQTTTLLATIGYTGTLAPTGTVSFYEDGVALYAYAVSNGQASLTSSVFSSKTSHTFYAVYSGDANFKTSTSPQVTTQASTGTTTTTTTVTTSATTVSAGGTATLSASITPSTGTTGTAATGTVTFSSTQQGTLCTAAVSSFAASCAATFTTTGTQTVTATYSGDTTYAPSTSATAVTITVGAASTTGGLTLIVSPSTAVMYGSTVQLASFVTATPTGTAGPAGTVSFAVSTALTYSAVFTPSSITTAAASTTIPAPAPGTYTVTATCTGTNFSCTGLSATATLTTIKGNTTTTVTASPTNPVAGQTTTLTATVAPSTTANAAALAPTGTVTFYINGTATSAIAVTNGVATYSTVLTATTGSAANVITAVYSGDTNWNASTSSQITVTVSPLPTVLTLSANQTTVLYTANVVLSATVGVTTPQQFPSASIPYGTITFYDLYNGQSTLIGSTTTLAPSGPFNATGQISTTGLMKGTHQITAYYSANTLYAAATANIVINVTDYGVSFTPQSLNLTRGSGGAAIATITAYNGFAGQVVLGCTPPAGTLMTCSFSPAVISVAGTSVLSVTTTAATARERAPVFPGRTATEVSVAALLLTLLLPGVRRRRGLVLAILCSVMLVGSVGCSTVTSTATTGTGTSTGGTPLGTQLLTITTQGSDGMTTVRHDTVFSVTVQ